MNKFAIAFDFDGTLIQGGWHNLDKGIHIMFSTWVACRKCGFEQFIHPLDISGDVDLMLSAYIRYPGSPRFEQLSAIINSLINHKTNSVNTPSKLNINQGLRDKYKQVKDYYNNLYSSLNKAAAAKHWAPYPAVMQVLQKLSLKYDIYICSGVTEDILINDFKFHGFNKALFKGIYGGNINGGSNKGDILLKIKNKGYEKVLFVGDSNKDLEYALQAATNFFRIKDDKDFTELVQITEKGSLPHQPDSWTFTEQELNFFKFKTQHLLKNFIITGKLQPEEITDYINNQQGAL
jgi:phosphoglycolate phosphatase-like HAD superfamily hydrolase